MKRRTLLLAMLLATAFAAQTFAAGTPAGTSIKNWAVGNYKDANGNDMTTVYSDTVETIVAQAAGVNVDPDGGKNVQRNSFVDYPVTITNTGNGSDTFALSAPAATDGNSTFTAVIYVDTNGDGIKQPTETTTTSSTGALAADGEYDVIVRVTHSNTTDAGLGDSADNVLTATSAFNGSVSDIATLTTTVLAAEIDGDLTVDNQTKAPGEVVTYTLIFNNTAGTDTAYNTQVTLPVPTDMEWVGNVTFNGTATGTGQGVAVNAGDMEPGEKDTITYQVRVPADAEAGDYYDNTVNINFDDVADNAYPQKDVSTVVATDRVTVSQNFSFTAIAADDSLEGNPGDNVQYSIKVKNTGNGTDNYDITESGGQTWPWTFYLDANNDGVADGGSITNTGGIDAGDSTWVLAVIAIPNGAADGAEDVTDVVFTAQVDPANGTQTERLTTTVTAPLLVLDKSVSPEGNQTPGTTLTYTIDVDNTGTGQATSVVITDTYEGANLTYVDGSLRIDGAVKSDGTGDDEASHNAGSYTVTYSLGTMAAGASHTCSFQVTIK